MFGELFSGALQENPVIAPGQLHEIIFTEFFGNHFAAEGMCRAAQDLCQNVETIRDSKSVCDHHARGVPVNAKEIFKVFAL